MKEPYIKSNWNSISAFVTDDVANKGACIYQHTGNTCKFSLGSKGVQQIEFDYEMYGDPYSNWLSFWVNSDAGGGKWVAEAEIDSLELMNRRLAHNFAGYGHQPAFKSADAMNGHVTTWMNEYSAQATDCTRGSQSCAKTGDIASQKWGSGSA
jgi:hypothetical protein